MRYLTTATSRPQAETIRTRLQADGIVTVAQGDALPYGASVFGTLDIYVDEKDFDSARALLKGSEGISEAELVEAEEADAAARAARPPMPPPTDDAPPASARHQRLWARLRGD